MTSPTASERRRRDRLIIVLSVVLSLLLVGSCFAVPYMPYILTGGGASREGRGALRDKAAGGEESAELVGVLRGSEAYARAQNIVEANYVDEVDPGCLLRSAARGIRRLSETGADEGTLVERGITAMVDSLDDPFSSFMSADELAMLDTQLSGRLSGIGVALEKVKNEIRVTRVIEGTPAHEAGLQDGDIVKEVDGRDVGSMELEEAVFLIRGPEGTKVRLGLVRPPSLEVNHYEIVRREIEIPVIRTEMREGGVGYLRLTDWTEDVDDKVSQALADFSSRRAKSLVIDLRSNPGGYMEPAIRVADMFLREGVIVSSRGRVGGTTRDYRADGEVEWDLPVVVLINRGTASSSEIFSAALRENDRCVLVGETTFGKGSIQKIFRHEDGTGLRLTIARYYTPKGVSIDDEGIAPDIKAKNPVVGEEDVQLERALEAARAGP
jgi:carboxyl-terminal processing protease